MGRRSISLAEEAKAAIAPQREVGMVGSRRAVVVRRVLAVRSRFLPYVVAGGAVACGYFSVTVATKDNIAVVFGAAIVAGIVAGIAVGWALLSLFLHFVERGAFGRRRVAAFAAASLTLPAYAVAGWASTWVGWIVGRTLSHMPLESGQPNAWGLLFIAAVAVYPLSYAFARRDFDRPEAFTAALIATTSEIREDPRSWTMVGAFLIGVTWCFGVLFAMYGVAIGVRVLFRDYLQHAEPDALWLAIAFFVAWISLTVGGTAWTLRALSRRRSRAASRSGKPKHPIRREPGHRTRP